MARVGPPEYVRVPFADHGAFKVPDGVPGSAQLRGDGRPRRAPRSDGRARPGRTISIVGVYGGFVDKFPMGAAMNKALVFRMGQQNGQHYVPRLLEHLERGEIDPSFLMTHRMSLEEGPRGYELFKNKREGCVRVVFTPTPAASA